MKEKEFEKQTLEQLLNDIKDIDNYKSFRNGAFVYDLGHYQGQLILQEINRLNNKINKAIKYIEENFYEVGGCIGGSDMPYQPIQDLLDILEGGKNE